MKYLEWSPERASNIWVDLKIEMIEFVMLDDLGFLIKLLFHW